MDALGAVRHAVDRMRFANPVLVWVCDAGFILGLDPGFGSCSAIPVLVWVCDAGFGSCSAIPILARDLVSRFATPVLVCLVLPTMGTVDLISNFLSTIRLPNPDMNSLLTYEHSKKNALHECLKMALDQGLSGFIYYNSGLSKT